MNVSETPKKNLKTKYNVSVFCGSVLNFIQSDTKNDGYLRGSTYLYTINDEISVRVFVPIISLNSSEAKIVLPIVGQHGYNALGNVKAADVYHLDMITEPQKLITSHKGLSVLHSPSMPSRLFRLRVKPEIKTQKIMGIVFSNKLREKLARSMTFTFNDVIYTALGSPIRTSSGYLQTPSSITTPSKRVIEKPQASPLARTLLTFNSPVKQKSVSPKSKNKCLEIMQLTSPFV